MQEHLSFPTKFFKNFSIFLIMINTTNDKDSDDRVAVFLFNSNKEFLIGVTPQNYKTKDQPHKWDIAGKGHIPLKGSPEEAAVKEVYEETNIHVEKSSLLLLDCIDYGKGKMYLYATYSSTNFDNRQTRCNSCFEMYGRKFPELKLLIWTSLADAKTFLNKKLCEAFDKFNVWNTLEEYLGGLVDD